MRSLNVTCLLRRRRSKRNSGSSTRKGLARELRETSRALRAPFIPLPRKAFLSPVKKGFFYVFLLMRPTQGNPRQSWTLDSTQWILDSKYWMVVSLSVELGFQIQIVSGIPDSLSCILDSKAQDSRFQKWPVCRPASSDVWKAPLGRFYLPVYNSYFTCCFCFRLWLTLLTDAIPLLEHEEVGDFGCVCFFFL